VACAFAKLVNTLEHNATLSGAQWNAPTTVVATQTPMAFASATLDGLGMHARSPTAPTDAMTEDLARPMEFAFVILASVDLDVRLNFAPTIAHLVEPVSMDNANAQRDLRELTAHLASAPMTAANTDVASTEHADASLDSEDWSVAALIAPTHARTMDSVRKVHADATLVTLETTAQSAFAPTTARTMVSARTSLASATLDTPDLIAGF